MSMIEQEGNLEEGTQDQLTPQPAYNRVDLTEFSSLIYQVKQEFSKICLLYTSPSPRDKRQSRMPSSA